MKREVMLVGGRKASQYINQSDYFYAPSIRIPVITDKFKVVSEDATAKVEYEIYHLQKYRSSNGAEFLWYVLEGVDALEELSFTYSKYRCEHF